jgi:hypothetical protein
MATLLKRESAVVEVLDCIAVTWVTLIPYSLQHVRCHSVEIGDVGVQAGISYRQQHVEDVFAPFAKFVRQNLSVTRRQ